MYLENWRTVQNYKIESSVELNVEKLKKNKIKNFSELEDYIGTTRREWSQADKIIIQLCCFKAVLNYAQR